MPREKHEGATVFTTLEPCMHRNFPKIPCADRLVEAKVSRVVIGCMDPDERGRGWQKLVDAKIHVELFDSDLVLEIAELNKEFIESRKKSSVSRAWFREIEKACGNSVKILADLKEAPHMNNVGRFDFPSELLGAYKRNKEENDRLTGGWCETIAEFKRLSPSGEVIDFEEYDYVQWKTLREAGRKPVSIYAGAVLVCPDKASIYVHKRSPEVATEPGKFHAFLGGFQIKHQNNRDDTLLHACLREVHEESSSQPQFADSRVVVVENLNIGWIDVVFMGGTISSENAKRLKGSKEGEVHAISFENLENAFCDNPEMWVPNGIAHHLVWLKLGAPGAPAWFREGKATETYLRIIERLSAVRASKVRQY